MKMITAYEARELNEKIGTPELIQIMDCIIQRIHKGHHYLEYNGVIPLTSESEEKLIELGYKVTKKEGKNIYIIEW